MCHSPDGEEIELDGISDSGNLTMLYQFMKLSKFRICHLTEDAAALLLVLMLLVFARTVYLIFLCISFTTFILLSHAPSTATRI